MTARWRNDIVVGHFVRSDTGHMMQAIDVTRHSSKTQKLFPSTTIISFVCCFRFACKKWLLITFGTTLVSMAFISVNYEAICVLSPLFVQLMHTNYYNKIVKQLKSFKILIVAPTCFGIHKPSTGSSQPVLC